MGQDTARFMLMGFNERGLYLIIFHSQPTYLTSVINTIECEIRGNLRDW